MNTFKLLAQYEFRSLLPSSNKQSIWVWLLAGIFCIMIGTYVEFPFLKPAVIFAVGTVLVIGVIIILSIIHVGSLFTSKYRDWWLTFPHSRMLLVMSKVAGQTRAGYLLAIGTMFVCAGIYRMRVWTGTMELLSMSEMLSMIGAYVLFIVVFVPIAVVYGLSLSLMYSGLARWALIPYCVGMILPFAVMGIIFSLDLGDQWLISWPYVLSYCGWIIVIGWPLAYVMVRLIAGRGMKSFGDVRILNANAGKEAKETRSNVKNNGLYCKSQGFAALYQLDRSRFRYYESKLWFQIMTWVILIMVGVVAFFGVQKPKAAFEVFTSLYRLPTLLAIVLSMMRTGSEGKTIIWWLGFPGSRSRLLLSHIAAVCVTTLRFMLFLTTAYSFGALVALWGGQTSRGYLLESIPWQIYSLILSAILLFLSLALLQLAYFSIKSYLSSIFMLPLFWFIITQNTNVNKYFYLESSLDMNQPLLWGRLGYLVLITIPLSIFCIWLGGRNFNHVIDKDIKIQSLFEGLPNKAK